MAPTTTYDVHPIRGAGSDLDRHIDEMDLAAFAERVAAFADRVARIDHRHPFVRASKAKAQHILGLLESELQEDARRGPTCAVAYGRVRGALHFAQQMGLIEIEEHERRSRRADELYLRRGQ